MRFNWPWFDLFCECGLNPAIEGVREGVTLPGLACLSGLPSLSFHEACKLE